jgi:hypothetical protein
MLIGPIFIAATLNFFGSFPQQAASQATPTPISVKENARLVLKLPSGTLCESL